MKLEEIFERAQHISVCIANQKEKKKAKFSQIPPSSVI